MLRKNSTLKPSKLRRRRRKIFAVKTIMVFLLLIVFIFSLSLFSKISFFQIENIEVFGNSTVSKDEIVDVIRKETSAKYFMLFSKNNFFLYPRKSMEKNLTDDFKKIKKITIKSKGFKSIIVEIIERKPNSLWCFSDMEKERVRKIDHLGGCYFLDEKGVIFSESPDFSGNAFVRYHGLLDDVEQPIGKTYLSEEKFQELSQFVNLLEGLGLMAIEFYAESESEYKINLKNGVKIILDDKQPFSKILENIQAISEEVDLKNEFSASRLSKINYIDLRFGNKVYLKSE